jgi:hypothetical protein
MICELCQYEMISGTWGQKQWVCTNEKCERSDPVWKSDLEKEMQRLLLINSEEINKLTHLSILGRIAKITTHSVRWMGDGSGIISFENGDSVTFIKSKNHYEYDSEDLEFLEAIKELKLSEILDKLRYLSVERLSEIIK